MKLDVLVSSLRGGGAERAAAALSSVWAQAGHQVRLLTLEPLDRVDYRPAPEVELVSLAHAGPAASLPLVRVLTRLRRLRRACVAQPQADLVIAIQANMAIEAALACLGSGLKIIGCERNIPSRAVRGRLWLRLRPVAYRRLAAVMTQTEAAARELAPICPTTPIRVIPNILRLPLADLPPRRVAATIVPSGAPLLLAVGRLVPAKGFDILLNRFAQLVAEVPQARLVILGEGPKRAALEAQIRDLGLHNRVSLPGRAGNLAEWYGRGQLFVMTSRWEGMPMALIEAMGHGLVPVVTDFPHGPREVIRDGEDGVILPEDDAAGWVRTVAGLLADAPRRAEMGRRAQQVRTRFGEAAVLHAWNTLLDEVAAR